MNKPVVIEANADRACDCCKRVHRTLYNVDGYWMGKNCSEDYKSFKSWGNNSGWRKLWESDCVLNKKLEKLQRMTGAL